LIGQARRDRFKMRFFKSIQGGDFD